MNINDFSFLGKRNDCPICSGAVEDSFISVEGFLCVGGFFYSFCPSCDYYFINPQPNLSSIDHFYNTHGVAPITESVLENSFRDYLQKGRAYEMTDYLSKMLPYFAVGSRFLDFGCGCGFLLSHNKNRYDCWGVEISRLAQDFDKKNGLRVVGRLDDLSSSNFDLITAIDVIEHMPDPCIFLKALKDRLSIGGLLLLRLPVIDGLLFLRQQPECWKWVYAPYHLSMFSIKAIERISKKVGLSCRVRGDSTIHVTKEILLKRASMITHGAFLSLFKLILAITYPFVKNLLRRVFVSECIFVELSVMDTKKRSHVE